MREQLVSPLASRVIEIVDRTSPTALVDDWDDACRALAPEISSDGEAGRLARGLAQAGYAAREAELGMFEPARAGIPWLGQEIAARRAAAVDEAAARRAACLELALTEPDERPAPDSGAASWRVPGPGAHVRHLVALEVAAQLAERLLPGRSEPPRGLSRPRDVKRCFLYGFLLRCCEEAGS